MWKTQISHREGGRIPSCSKSSLPISKLKEKELLWASHSSAGYNLYLWDNSPSCSASWQSMVLKLNVTGFVSVLNIWRKEPINLSFTSHLPYLADHFRVSVPKKFVLNIISEFIPLEARKMHKNSPPSPPPCVKANKLYRKVLVLKLHSVYDEK